MTRFFIRLYRYFAHHRLQFHLLWVGAMLGCALLAMQLHLEEDINKLMPSSRNPDGSVKLAFADLHIKDKTFLLFEGGEGVGPEQLAEVCDAFADSLLARDAASGDVATDDAASRMVGDLFYRLPETLWDDALEYLYDHLPLFLDSACYAELDQRLTPGQMIRQMQANRSDLESDWGSAYPELIESDPVGLRQVLLDRLPALSDSRDRSGEGSGGYRLIDNHIFVADSTVCLAFITPAHSATNTGQGSRLFVTLNELIDAFATTHPEVSICYHGTPASGFYNASQIKHDLCFTVGGALVLVLLLLGYSFRSVRFVALLLLPVTFGTLFGMAAIYLIKGEFSLLALGIGAVVLGVAMSYVLHLLVHSHYVQQPEELLRHQVKPICMGCLTTVGSFVGLFFIHTDLLRDFGLFAAWAIIGTTLFSLFFLPHYTTWIGLKQDMRYPVLDLIGRFNRYPLERCRPLLGVILLVAAVCIGAFCYSGAQFDADMHNLGYKEERVKHSEQLLRSKTYSADKQKYFAASGATMEEALEHFDLLAHKLDSLQQLGLVKGYLPTHRLLIPLRVQEQRLQEWQAYWSEERLQQVGRLIHESAPAAGLRPEGFNRFFEYVTSSFAPDALYEAGLIPAGYLSTLVEQSADGRYLCFTSVRCAEDTIRSRQSDYYRICDAISSSPHLLVLDTYYYTVDTLTAMNEDFNVLQWVSMLFVFLVLWVSFRGNLRHTLLGMMPILLSWMIVLGAMALFGVRFNLISIIISTFIFGIGVDYSIFVMDGLTRGEQADGLFACHKTAILLSALLLILTVGSMLLARHPAICSVGFSTLVGLLAAVVLSLVVQPALYRIIKTRVS